MTSVGVRVMISCGTVEDGLTILGRLIGLCVLEVGHPMISMDGTHDTDR